MESRFCSCWVTGDLKEAHLNSECVKYYLWMAPQWFVSAVCKGGFGSFHRKKKWKQIWKKVPGWLPHAQLFFFLWVTKYSRGSPVFVRNEIFISVFLKEVIKCEKNTFKISFLYKLQAEATRSFLFSSDWSTDSYTHFPCIHSTAHNAMHCIQLGYKRMKGAGKPKWNNYEF